MSRRLRPQNLSNLSSSIPDDLDYEKLTSKPQDNAVLAGCGATPRISLDEVQSAYSPKGKKKHRRAVSSFSFARKLQVDTESSPPPATHTTEHHTSNSNHTTEHHTSNSLRIDDITSPQETHTLVDLEKGLPPIPSGPPLTAQPIRRAATNQIKVDREIWKMLLLNMYPVTYLILWMPGLANRIAEGMGHSQRALVIMQSSTQFIGLANAAVYLYKEHRRDVREWWSGIKERKAAKVAKVEHIGSNAGSTRVRQWTSVSSTS
jgi:hypothetical protein